MLDGLDGDIALLLVLACSQNVQDQVLDTKPGDQERRQVAEDFKRQDTGLRVV